MGEYSHSLDAKGRLMMPAQFRNDLGASCVLTRGLEGCLSVYTMDAWKCLVESMKQLPASKSNVRSFKRFLFGSAAVVEFDKQGRILIPASLRAYGHLSKEVTVIGTGDKLEIWDKDAYEEYSAKIIPDMEEIAETLDASLDIDF